LQEKITRLGERQGRNGLFLLNSRDKEKHQNPQGVLSQPFSFVLEEKGEEV
jgi:hypothetical protein